MRLYVFLALAVLTGLIHSCGIGQNKNNFSAKDFSEKIKETPGALILDVRTPDEFSKGHLINAVNIDWNGNDFDSQVQNIDKKRPVFIYCLSGGRSAAAAAKLRSDGYKEVYEMKGGIAKWRAADLPETNDNANASTGLNKAQFDKLINQDKIVLVDFYAEWCAPCKKMKPYIEEIEKENPEKVVLVRINADDNPFILKQLNVDELPTLQLYKKKTLYWTGKGLMSKEDILSHVKQLF